MKKYIFPMNYTYSSKFLGILDYKTLVPLSIYASVLIFLLHILKIDFFIAFGIFIFLTLPPLLLLSIGINNQPAISYFKAIYYFSKNSKLYLFKNDCQNSQKRL